MQRSCAVMGLFGLAVLSCTSAWAQDTTLVARFTDGESGAYLSLGTGASSGQKTAMIVIQTDPDDPGSLHGVMFTSDAEWAEFEKIWQAARSVSPPHETKAEQYQPPDDDSMVSVNAEDDGGITITTLDGDVGSDAAFVEIEPQDFATFEAAASKVSAYLAP